MRIYLHLAEELHGALALVAVGAGGDERGEGDGVRRQLLAAAHLLKQLQRRAPLPACSRASAPCGS
eukprot:4528054-Pyramimonas_sp.AAC.1